MLFKTNQLSRYNWEECKINQIVLSFKNGTPPSPIAFAG